MNFVANSIVVSLKKLDTWIGNRDNLSSQCDQHSNNVQMQFAG